MAIMGRPLPYRANWLPILSTVTLQPREAISSANQRRTRASSSERASRDMPVSFGPLPQRFAAPHWHVWWRVLLSRSALILSAEAGDAADEKPRLSARGTIRGFMMLMMES